MAKLKKKEVEEEVKKIQYTAEQIADAIMGISTSMRALSNLRLKQKTL